jgi:hypothetical protein
MALIRPEFYRDYQGHREQALRDLRRVYSDFETELKRVIPLLKDKAQL